MRPLTEEETKMVFEKLYKFIGKNIKSLIDRPEDPHCFRLQKNRVFYVRETLMKKATNVSIQASMQNYMIFMIMLGVSDIIDA